MFEQNPTNLKNGSGLEMDVLVTGIDLDVGNGRIEAGALGRNDTITVGGFELAGNSKVFPFFDVTYDVVNLDPGSRPRVLQFFQERRISGQRINTRFRRKDFTVSDDVVPITDLLHHRSIDDIGKLDEFVAKPPGKIIGELAAMMGRPDRDHPLDRWIGMEEQHLPDLLSRLVIGLQLFERTVAEDPPEFITTFNGLQPGHQSAHAVSNQNHFIQRQDPVLWIEILSHLGQILPHLFGAQPKRLTGWI